MSAAAFLHFGLAFGRVSLGCGLALYIWKRIVETLFIVTAGAFVMTGGEICVATGKSLVGLFLGLG